ncbi:DMT family transporter [Rugosimonospora africana]|uniref:Membrane protein n=1 Tax=Rugosimonospora africana TaxID=556532 RepID=A0A8J3VNL5_9ACTN|nr:DMT family transporter [Rugosimonospora africana]GIH12972.1 membrane protein [Rugosimonospora africana]
MSHSRSAPDRPNQSEPHRYLSGCALSAVAGAVLALQSRINGDFGHRVHDGVLAALISFSSSLTLCTLILALFAVRGKAGALIRQLRANRLPPWYYLGGIAGAYTLISQGEAVTALGVAVFTIAAVSGQSIASLVIDRLGIGPSGRQPVTAFRLIGAVLSIGSVIVAVSGKFHTPEAIGLIVLPVVAGIVTPLHQALNGRVRAASHSTLAPTLINFVVGTALLLPVFGIEVAIRGAPGNIPTPPWPAYVGGPLGVTFIAITVTVVRQIGVLLLALATIAGQLVMAIILDLIAPTAGMHPGPATYVGTALTIVAVAVAAIHRRR